MSDLQLGLMAAGALFVVLVLAYNKWQDRRLRRQGDAAFGSRHDDVLLTAKSPSATAKDVRIEPVLVNDAEPALPENLVAHDLVPAMQSASDAEVRAETPAAPEVSIPTPGVTNARPLPLDGSVDAIAMLTPAEGGTIDATAIVSADWSAFSKTVSRFGEQDGVWGELGPNRVWERVLVGLQLVDRKGPVPGMDVAAFAGLLDDLAHAHGWQLEIAAGDTISQQAAQLDRLCAEIDFQINIAVVAASDKPFVGTRIRAVAEEYGMVLADDGSFKRVDREGTVLFTLKNRGATPFSEDHIREFSTRGLMLGLDVPRVPRDAYPAMRSLAGSLCNALQGTIADEQGHVLDDAALDRVAAQLEAIHARLERSGIHPGSALALRLFS